MTSIILNKILANLDKNLLTLLLILISGFTFGQKDSTVKLTVYIKKNLKGQRPLPYSDSLKIQFDLGFKNDIVKIETGNKAFTTKILNTDILFGHAGTLLIPKAQGRQSITIYLNNDLIGKIILNKRFSAAHIDNFDKKFTWTYINYRFFYL